MLKYRCKSEVSHRAFPAGIYLFENRIEIRSMIDRAIAGSYVGVDIPGTVTGIGFGQAVLIARKWQLAFTVGNDLLADANVNLGKAVIFREKMWVIGVVNGGCAQGRVAKNVC